MRSARKVVVGLLLCLLASACTTASVDVAASDVRIGVHVRSYPELALVPGYPVYYAPGLGENYFFYDGLFWVFTADRWYRSDWYNGPWDYVAVEYVPVYILRVPVYYYRRPPTYFRSWRAGEPPRWGERWGHEWEARHPGWSRHEGGAKPAPAPRPEYQRRYSGRAYPAPAEQRRLRTQYYPYQPRENVARPPRQAPEQRRDQSPAQEQGRDRDWAQEQGRERRDGQDRRREGQEQWRQQRQDQYQDQRRDERQDQREQWQQHQDEREQRRRDDDSQREALRPQQSPPRTLWQRERREQAEAREQEQDGRREQQEARPQERHLQERFLQGQRGPAQEWQGIGRELPQGRRQGRSEESPRSHESFRVAPAERPLQMPRGRLEVEPERKVRAEKPEKREGKEEAASQAPSEGPEREGRQRGRER